MFIRFLRTSLRGAEFFYVYDGDGNAVRSIDIWAEKEYNYGRLGTYIICQLFLIFPKKCAKISSKGDGNDKISA